MVAHLGWVLGMCLGARVRRSALLLGFWWSLASGRGRGATVAGTARAGSMVLLGELDGSQHGVRRCGVFPARAIPLAGKASSPPLDTGGTRLGLVRGTLASGRGPHRIERSFVGTGAVLPVRQWARARSVPFRDHAPSGDDRGDRRYGSGDGPLWRPRTCVRQPMGDLVVGRGAPVRGDSLGTPPETGNVLW
jgi:hypothetical protein